VPAVVTTEAGPGAPLGVFAGIVSEVCLNRSGTFILLKQFSHDKVLVKRVADR
jgi:hypothetical protein